MANYFGILLAMVFPTNCIEFLGISINSLTMEFSLPEEKIVCQLDLLNKILTCKKSNLRELQSLLGMLVFTSKVIPMGYVFTKRLYKATCGLKSPRAHIRITKPSREDMKIWVLFLNGFNSQCIWQEEFASIQSLNFLF